MIDGIEVIKSSKQMPLIILSPFLSQIANCVRPCMKNGIDTIDTRKFDTDTDTKNFAIDT